MGEFAYPSAPLKPKPNPCVPFKPKPKPKVLEISIFRSSCFSSFKAKTFSKRTLNNKVTVSGR
jgi:hypothetical protein